MRIVFDYQIFSRQEYGGVSRYIYELARELANRLGQDVNIVSPLYSNEYLKKAPHDLNIWGIPIFHLPRMAHYVQNANSLLSKPILKFVKPDIVHETYYSYSRTAPKNSKVILTVYDMIHEKYPESFSSSDATRYKKSAALARADHVICISKQTQRDLIELTDIEPEKTSVIHLGFTLTNKNTRKSEPIQGKPYLLYVGNRSRHKNFAGFLRAVAVSPNLQNSYRIICFGGGPLTSQEKALISKLGFHKRDVCQLSGSDKVLAGLYQNATALIYPSLYEGFGIPPLEAMSFNCPVACSNYGSIPEVVGDAGAYFDPGNIEDMAETIEQLVTEDLLRKQLIVKGQERIKFFSWERCAAETLEVYRRVLK